VEKIRLDDSIRIRILTPDSIRDSIRTQTPDSQVPITESQYGTKDNDPKRD